MTTSINNLPNSLEIKDDDYILIEQTSSNKISVSDFKSNISRLSGTESAKKEADSFLEKEELFKSKIQKATNHILEVKQTIANMVNQLLDSDDVQPNDESIISGINRIESNSSLKRYYEDNATDLSFLFKNASMEVAPMFNTENATSMTEMFSNCSNLISVPLYNTINVKNVHLMFYNCVKLNTIPLFNTSNVTNMYGMFSGCKELNSVPMLDSSNVTDVQEMFKNCTNLISIPRLNLKKVTNMCDMFYNCQSLESVSLDTANVVNMRDMFYNCQSLKSVSLDTSNVVNMRDMFYNCQSLESVYLDTKNVTVMSDLFKGCVNLTKLRFNPDAGYIKDFSISDCTKMTSEDLVAMFESLPTPKASRTITLGSVLLGKLSEEQKQIAINKGYVLS